jgi:hypothetical protein
MGEVTLMRGALAASANRLAGNLALGLRAGGPDQPPTTFLHAGSSIPIEGAATISPAQITRLEQGLAALPSVAIPLFSLNRLSPTAVEDGAPDVPDVVGGAALAVDPKILFGDARKRIDSVFVLNYLVTIVVTVILIGAIVGVLGFAFVGNLSANALASLVTAVVADLLFAYAYKPLGRMQNATIAVALLEASHLRLHQQLGECAKHGGLNKRIECQARVWETFQHELSALTSP